MGKILRVEPMWLMGFDVSKKKEPTPDMAKEDFKLLEKVHLSLLRLTQPAQFVRGQFRLAKPQMLCLFRSFICIGSVLPR